MIDRVSFTKTRYAESPQKFEAGTPNVGGAIGLGVAASVIAKLDFQKQHEHVLALRTQLIDAFVNNEKLDLYEFPGTSYTGVISFNIKGSHPSDVGTLFDKYGIAVRAGHHCTQPVMDLMGVPGTVRVSLSAFNSQDEIEYFLNTLKKVEEFF